MSKTCSVYWIHRPEHTDITTQGYVGVSVDTTKRFNAHKWSSKTGNYILHNAIRKYGYDNLVFEEIFQSNRVNCLSLEQLLRPQPYVGWNICVGGGSPSTLGHCSKKQSTSWSTKLNKIIPTFDDYSASLEQEITDLHKELESMPKTSEMTEARRRKFSIRKRLRHLEVGPWSNSYSNNLWLYAQEYYNTWLEDGCCGSRRLSRLLGFDDRNKTITTMISHFNSGWIPQLDKRWRQYEESKGYSKAI